MMTDRLYLTIVKKLKHLSQICSFRTLIEAQPTCQVYDIFFKRRIRNVGMRLAYFQRITRETLCWKWFAVTAHFGISYGHTLYETIK